MVFAFTITYIYMTYVWWSSYSEQLRGIPKIRGTLGILLLAGFGMYTEPVTLLLLFTFISTLFHLSKDQWNPFHSGIVGGSIVGILVVMNAAIQGADPITWLQASENAELTFALAGFGMGAFTLATIRTGNPLRHITFLSGRYEQRNHIPVKDPETFNNESSESSPQSGSGTESDSLDAEIEELRLEPEHHPFRDDPQNNSGSSQNDHNPSPQKNANQSNGDLQEDKTDESSYGEEKPNQDSDVDNDPEHMSEEEVLLEDQPDLDELQFPWEKPPEMRFENIGGYTGVKENLNDQVIAPLKGKTESYERFNVEPSRGILFHGPPGTGKTLFARALAHELDRPFVELSQADLTHEFVNKSPQIVNRLFKEAQAVGGVVFIDEAEQLLGGRGDSMNTHAEDQKITNTFLSALTMEEKNFLVLFTTNRRDSMDEAILRPGRIDEEFEIGMPGPEARTKILKVKVAGIPHKLSEKHVKMLASKTEGWSGADLNNLVNQAKIIAANRNAKHLTLEDLKEAYNDTRPDIE